jgi:protein TonB
MAESNLNTLRLPVAAVFAAGVTFSLFLFMHQLVSSGAGNAGALTPISGIHFGPVDIPEEITSRSRIKPPKPPPPSDPPPPPRMEIARVRQDLQPIPQMNIPNLDVPIIGGAGVYIGGFQQVDPSAEGDVIPVVVIRPMYPREAAISGIEGWVKVEFTISETGTVRSPRVVEADPPRVFNREALRAILKWKFKPRVVEGVAVERLATQVIEFNLDE